MKIQSHQIHPDLRRQGVLSRKLFRFESEKSLIRVQKIIRRMQPLMKSKTLVMEQHTIQAGDNPGLRLCVYRGRQTAPGAVGLLWLHGGGYAMGIPEQDLGYIQNLIEAAGCVVVAPDYRLSTQQPYPAALTDCYQALLWMRVQAEGLGVRSDQLFVGGNSAGGGLCVALCLMARDRDDVRLAFQMPLYPMLDDRMITPSSRDNDAPVWDSTANALAWKLYLGPLYQSEQVPAYAAPARARDVSGLPPAYSFVGDIEPFYDETRMYMERLRRAWIAAELDVYPGCFHGFNVGFPKAPISRRATRRYQDAFAKACQTCFVPQP